WSRPMCGSQRSTISPSISTTSRSTPCAAGCCGPKFMVSVLISTSDMSARLGRFLVARQDPLDAAFPGTQEVEPPELLGKLDRLVDHALLHIVPAHLDEAGQREVLAQRMALEAVVSQDPPQIGMVGEPHTVEIVGLALEPRCRAVHCGR